MTHPKFTGRVETPHLIVCYLEVKDGKIVKVIPAVNYEVVEIGGVGVITVPEGHHVKPPVWEDNDG